MPSTSLQPLLRTATHSSSLLPQASSSQSSTFICSQCRHARLLRRPKRPYTFTQLITLSDGSAFTARTTSPFPVYRSTRDTRNAPLWNPSSKELLNVEEDEAGRLSGFRARYGGGFDRVGETGVDTKKTKLQEGIVDVGVEGGPDVQMTSGETVIDKKGRERTETVVETQEEERDEWEYGEDDKNLLDLISSFGQEILPPGKAPPPKKKK